MTVHEVSRLSGVSIRTLHYYDSIGLLTPPVTTDNGYRLYDDESLAKLQQILLFRELELPLKEIRAMLNDPTGNRSHILDHQIALLTRKRDHLDNLIRFAKGVRNMQNDTRDFSVFDRSKQEQYFSEAKQKYGTGTAWKEYEQKSAGRSFEKTNALAEGLMEIFTEFGSLRGREPSDPAVQMLTVALQKYISEHYYTCTKEIFSSLGEMYAAVGEMTENIDRAGGIGTALLASEAIRIYCASC